MLYATWCERIGYCMAFKRALWKSGLTYEQTCEHCRTVIRYTDDRLDFRPWYPDGFVYCPQCKSPVRHNEVYAINPPATQTVVDLTGSATPSAPQAVAPVGGARFCPQCGNAFQEIDKFCAKCGTKRG